MYTLDQELRNLVAQACQSPLGSLERQERLTILVQRIIKSGKLWRDSAPYYGDVVQKAWIYFCRNLCEAATADEPYCADKASVITWLNGYIKWELHKARSNVVLDQRRRASVRTFESDEALDPVDLLEAPPDIPPILELTQQWAETDADGELRRIHIKGYPQITCQLLILRRLPPETGWKELSAELGPGISALSSFYQRQCLPRLRKFGEAQGYL
jgi:hypothetical protein